MANRRLFLFLILMLLSFQTLLTTAHEDPSYKEVQVGVLLDMESWVGKIVYGCITQAISDFYTENPHYRTRLVFTKRDTQGETLRALSAALDLLENSKVKAIIGPESTAQARFLENPYFLRIAEDETTQFKGIAGMVESFEAKNVIVICEDTTDGREMAAYMFSAFQEKRIQVKHTSLISTSASKEQVEEDLHKLQTMETMVFVVHTQPSLTAHLFSRAKELGMMGEGYMWIITSKTTNLLNSMDAEAIKSMQGAVGFRSYFPASRKLYNFASKWREEHYALNPFKEFKELDIVGTSLLDEMLRLNFQSLGGEFKLLNGRTISKAMEVVNVIGKGDRRVGFWMMANGGEFVKEIGKSNSFSNHGLESIIWPGGSETSPK
ncbi:glutamate receptor 1.2-like [Lactuca sativa]|uniref:glutamate receptor 1.2-like n=1 Tax=Lactuca sativa TaxID=4236 RepID=UPI0022AF68CE|nr:glutamate receptor 1.2-like [Lactuca sativa]